MRFELKEEMIGEDMSEDKEANAGLGHADLIELKRWSTPTIYNGWEQMYLSRAMGPLHLTAR